jgi:CBS-domain-containing membrane protein
MERHVIYAGKNDLVERVLDSMADRNIKEIPVVDDHRRIIAVATLLDLWRLVKK